MKRRIFIAIMLSNKLQKAAMKWKSYKNIVNVRWIKDHNLHITLIEPWKTDDIDYVKKCLLHIENIKPFILNFNSISYGPNQRNPRLIWASSSTVINEMIELKEKLDNMFYNNNKNGNNKDFLSHITLARFKSEDFSKLPPIEEKIDWEEKVESVSLVESKISSQGSEYKILDKISLK